MEIEHICWDPILDESRSHQTVGLQLRSGYLEFRYVRAASQWPLADDQVSRRLS